MNKPMASKKNNTTDGDELMQTLVLRGSQMIAQTNNLVDKLRNLLDGTGDLRIILQKPDNLDLSMVQLLVSARRTWTDKHRSFQLVIEDAEDWKLHLADCGFEDLWS